MEEARAIKVSREIKVAGYVVDEQVLYQVDSIASGAVSESDDDVEVKRQYLLSTTARESIPAASFDELIRQLSRAPERVRSLALRYTRRRQSGLDVVFSVEGEIRLSGFSSRPDFQFNVDQLHEALLAAREDYSWPVRALVLGPGVKKWLNLLLPTLSTFLLLFIGYYLHAVRVGVNVDPALLPRGERVLPKSCRGGQISRHQPEVERSPSSTA